MSNDVFHHLPSERRSAGYPADTWKADPMHSEIGFSVGLMMVGKVRGRFTRHDVTILSGEDPLDSSVAATIDLASIDTDKPRRDEHLRSATFLDVEKYPTMSYRSTEIRHIDDRWIIDGELTLHDVTRPVPLSVAMSEIGADPDGNRRVGFAATAQIERSDFGIDRWSGGGTGVGDKVSITLEIEAVRQR